MSKQFFSVWLLVFGVACLGESTAIAQKGKKPPVPAELKGVTNLAYSPDGSFMLIEYRTSPGQPDASDASLGIWDLKTGNYRTGLEKPPRGSDRVAISPDGKKAAAIAAGPRELKIWDTATGKLKEQQTLPAWSGSILHAPFLKFSSDGQFLYSIYNHRILEVKLGGKSRLIGGALNDFSPDEMAFDPAAKTYILVRNIMGRPRSELRVYNLAKEGESRTVRLNDHVRALALSQDGKTLAISYLRSINGKPRLELWDTSTFTLRTKMPADQRKDFQNYRAMTFSPDGKILAGTPLFETRHDEIVDLIDLEAKTSKQVTNKTFASSLTFSPDSKTLAVILFNNTLLFIDPATGEAKKP